MLNLIVVVDGKLQKEITSRDSRLLTGLNSLLTLLTKELLLSQIFSTFVIPKSLRLIFTPPVDGLLYWTTFLYIGFPSIQVPIIFSSVE